MLVSRDGLVDGLDLVLEMVNLIQEWVGGGGGRVLDPT